MSTHKNIERICIIITILAVLVTALFMNGERLGIVSDDSVTLGYEDKIFDDSYVHNIDIEIDDWDSFIENATSEEYSTANVTIDGETVKNVGIRAKGNTSLSTVSQLDSERYSLKIEFDCYQTNNTYYGLDKLCLNNLIQDYTMMKDYLTYKLMYEFGADAPLVSYCFITVNGEDWGLYLAVEAVEDAFLERNYGSSYGELYKPDSTSMGGGRGNGGGFDMREMDFDELGIPNPFESDEDGDSESAEAPPGGMEDSDTDSENADSEFAFAGDMENPFENVDFNGMTDEEKEAFFEEMHENGGMGSMGGPGGGGDNPGSGMGSDDAKLKYIDDDIGSYSNIFDTAKTSPTKSDKKRLINSLKLMNEGLADGDADEIAEAVNIDEVMRYMVVHNFVVNGDSYTGSMIHNYYLYEEDGLLSVIPWDYNLAFGTFQGNDADSAVNDPIDNPLSITDGDTDRPMFSWIISCDEYIELYHEYFREFIDEFYTNGYLSNLISSTYEMIYDYVDRDPTKFCTTEEFETAVDTISSFIELRCESIVGQLDGSIGSTDAEQEADPDDLIDASSITLSDMGSMGGGGGDHDGEGGGGHGGMGGHGGPGGGHGHGSSNDSNATGEAQSSGDSVQENAEASSDFLQEGIPGDDMSEGGMPSGDMGGMPGGDFGEMSGETSNVTTEDWIYTGICAAALIAAIAFALKYKGRR